MRKVIVVVLSGVRRPAPLPRAVTRARPRSRASRAGDEQKAISGSMNRIHLS